MCGCGGVRVGISVCVYVCVLILCTDIQVCTYEVLEYYGSYTAEGVFSLTLSQCDILITRKGIFTKVNGEPEGEYFAKIN